MATDTALFQNHKPGTLMGDSHLPDFPETQPTFPPLNKAKKSASAPKTASMRSAAGTQLILQAVADLKAEVLTLKKDLEVNSKICLAVAEATNVTNLQDFIAVPETPDSNAVDHLSDGLYKTLTFATMSHFSDNPTDLPTLSSPPQEITQALSAWVSFCSDLLSGKAVEDEWAVKDSKKRRQIFLHMCDWVSQRLPAPVMSTRFNTFTSPPQMGDDDTPVRSQQPLRTVSRAGGGFHARTKSTPAALQSPGHNSNQTLSPYGLTSPEFFPNGGRTPGNRTASSTTMRTVLRNREQSVSGDEKASDMSQEHESSTPRQLMKQMDGEVKASKGVNFKDGGL
ncbi:hypothetical protein PRZ48_008268 [Zasmidium cellare]|uniref:Uncharacterized protein n=1 Tax=Zasmidium cellare TaxID=395010 RepID=A0ABR0EF21_ZASCE|nr:hypothetical protein PRZ48_008268 [Zasmidium cellare]